jgi:hypothetical protein
MSTDDTLREKPLVEFEITLFEQELPEKRCVDLEYLLLSLPPSPWVITVKGVKEVEELEDANTSLGEDLGAEKAPESGHESGRGRTRVGKFTGRRRL